MQAHRLKDLAANGWPSSREFNDEGLRLRPRNSRDKYDQTWAKPSLAHTHRVHGEKGLARIEQRARTPDGRNPGPAGRACVCASVGHNLQTTPRLCRRYGMQRMAVFLQRAVSVTPAF